MFTDTAVSMAVLVLLQVMQSITGIEFLNHNSEEENGYTKLMTVSSSGWQKICSSPFCLSISDTLNNQQSITIHSIEIAVLNSLLTPNHSPNRHISQVPEPYALRSNVGASAQFCLGLTKMSAWYKK